MPARWIALHLMRGSRILSRSDDETGGEMPPGQTDGFDAPWQAALAALTVELSERGVFTWDEWTRAYAARLDAERARSGPNDGTRGFQVWLETLEGMLEARGIIAREALDRLARAWRHAHDHTPHGQPVRLNTGSEVKGA